MRFVYLLVLLVWLSVVSQAQSVSTSASPEITKAFVRDTVHSVKTLVDARYFNLSLIPVIDRDLDLTLDHEDFDRARDVTQLATLLTETLYRASHDKHLFVMASQSTGPSGLSRSRSEAARMSNFGVRSTDVLAGNVGYLKLTGFYRKSEGAPDVLATAMKLLSHTDALILDMRANGGGSPDTAVQLMSYFFKTGGVPLFQIVPRMGSTTEYKTEATGTLARDEHQPVYILVSSKTASAGEGVPFILQGMHRAKVVGQRTWGGANPAAPFPVNSLLNITIPFGHITSAIPGRNWEGSGVQPDIVTKPENALAVAYTRALKDLISRSTSVAEKEMLTKALSHVGEELSR